MRNVKVILAAVVCATAPMTVNAACSDLSYHTLKSAANDVLDLNGQANTTGGLQLPSWATMVDETGKVCHVVSTGEQTGAKSGNSQWLGSRVISAQKANTANAFSLDGVAISSGALYAAVQPGGSLYGLQHSNPVDASRAYKGNPRRYGKKNDPLVGKRVGGVNVFGGGLPLYQGGVKIGAIGVSGDTSCADHANAWAIREQLGLAGEPGTAVEKLSLTSGPFAALGDHPICGNSKAAATEEYGFTGTTEAGAD